MILRLTVLFLFFFTPALFAEGGSEVVLRLKSEEEVKGELILATKDSLIVKVKAVRRKSANDPLPNPYKFINPSEVDVIVIKGFLTGIQPEAVGLGSAVLAALAMSGTGAFDSGALGIVAGTTVALIFGGVVYWFIETEFVTEDLILYDVAKNPEKLYYYSRIGRGEQKKVRELE